MRADKMSRIYLGRHVYGFAAVICGILTFVWRDLNAWRQIMPLDKVTHPEILLYVAAAIELFGGVAIQWAPTRRIGAFSLGSIYFIFALLSVPHIVASPLTYDGWGSFFEQFSLVSGALIVFGAPGLNNHEGAPRARPERLTEGEGVEWAGAHRVRVLWNLRCFLCTRTTGLSFRNGKPRSKMDSSGTNVLGGNHHNCLCARRYRDSFRARRPSGISTTHGHADRLWAAGMAADCHLAPA